MHRQTTSQKGSIKMLRTSLVSVLLLGLVACATPQPQVAKVEAAPLKPRANEVVALDQLLVIVDASGSVPDSSLFPEERALVEAYVASVPAGRYEAGTVAFGGFERQTTPLSPLDRSTLEANAARLEHLRGGTPIHKVLGEARDSLSSEKGRAAVVIFSDGLATDEFGRAVEDERVVEAAREVASAHDGTVCFHTVQVGDSEVGAQLLRSISEVTSCGSFRTASAAASEPQLHAFHRQVFLKSRPAPPAVSAAPPVAAPGDRGPWSIQFGLDSSSVDSRYQSEIDDVSRQLKQSPDARVVVRGHTDSSGNPDYNRALSMRRAQATRDALVQAGVAPGRIEIEGVGPDAPLMPNDTDVHRRANRRTEIEIVR